MSDATETAATLRAAWDDLIAALGRARDAIDDPKLHAPPPSDRVLAEGYRYLLGWAHGAFERAFHADPARPHFRRAIQPISKSTIDNADALYLNAEIDGNRRYRLQARVRPGRKPPHYVIFEAGTAYAGDSGSIAELRPGSRAGTGAIDSSKLVVAPDGSFEILIAPARPDGYAGNFVATRKVRPAREPGGVATVHVARHLTLRELFHDWEHEDALDLELVSLDDDGTSPAPLGLASASLSQASAPLSLASVPLSLASVPLSLASVPLSLASVPLDAARAAAQLRRMAEIVENQMKFWNEFYAVVLETHADMNGDGQRFMPRNDFNAPNAATLATGGGQSTNVYAGGVYELGDDEALVVELRVPMPPLYQGFHLANLWGESLDYANHQSSLNGFQTEWESEGVAGDANAGHAGGHASARSARYVIAHRDPGVANWLDTTGLPVGFMTFRWTYAEAPGELPTVRVERTTLREVTAAMPATASGATRSQEIQRRRAAVERRYRQY